MFFNSSIFVLFLSLAVGIYWMLPHRLRALALTIFGCLFYAYYSITYLLLIAGLGIFTFIVGWHLRKKGTQRLAAFGITVLVLTLVGFKYLTLVISTVSELFGHASLWNISIALPLGISFFTFEFIHYIADIYRGKIGNHNFLTFLSFTFFFPTLVSGPIKRFETFESSLQEKQFLPAMFWTGCITILLGYSQKYLIADMLVPFTTALSAPQTIPTQTFAIAGIVCYAIRIYADFLGMSNIAIGSALLFGITVPKNFHAPYLSSDIALFWRRWHMSLSSWVRDYLYIPLGGNRVGRMREYANVFIVMTIVGLWHGASWNFAIWGLWHGIGLAFHRLWRDLRPEHAIFETRFAKLCGCFLTCAFVTIGWTFFVTTSLEDSFHLLSIIFFGTHV